MRYSNADKALDAISPAAYPDFIVETTATKPLVEARSVVQRPVGGVLPFKRELNLWQTTDQTPLGKAFVHHDGSVGVEIKAYMGKEVFDEVAKILTVLSQEA